MDKDHPICCTSFVNTQMLKDKLRLIITDRGSGGCNALDRNSEILPSCKLLICKHKDCNGVLRSSGS